MNIKLVSKKVCFVAHVATILDYIESHTEYNFFDDFEIILDFDSKEFRIKRLNSAYDEMLFTEKDLMHNPTLVALAIIGYAKVLDDVGHPEFYLFTELNDTKYSAWDEYVDWVVPD